MHDAAPLPAGTGAAWRHRRTYSCLEIARRHPHLFRKLALARREAR